MIVQDQSDRTSRKSFHKRGPAAVNDQSLNGLFLSRQLSVVLCSFALNIVAVFLFVPLSMYFKQQARPS